MRNVRKITSDQIVECPYVPTLKQQSITQMRSQESRPTGYHCPHALPPSIQTTILSWEAPISLNEYFLWSTSRLAGEMGSSGPGSVFSCIFGILGFLAVFNP